MLGVHPLLSGRFSRALMNDVVVFRPVDDRIAGKPALGARQRVIDQHVVPAAINLEIDDRGLQVKP